MVGNINLNWKPSLRTAILRERLVISPEEFVVTRRDIFGTKTTRLTSGEIEEVEVIQARYGMYGGYAAYGGGTGRVVIRNDRGSIDAGCSALESRGSQVAKRCPCSCPHLGFP
ncbi:MAG: hypothetical protein ACR2L2_19665 [Acidobacteriota bacterium]